MSERAKAHDVFPLIPAQAGIRGGCKEPDVRLRGDARETPASRFSHRTKAPMSNAGLPLFRPGQLWSAGVGAGFADHAIAPRRFGEIKPAVRAIEQGLIIGGVF